MLTSKKINKGGLSKIFKQFKLKKRKVMKIESIGYYLPPSTKLEDFIAEFPEEWQYPIHKKAGIERVRKVNIGEYALELSKKAVTRCLEISKYEKEDIDTIICCNICKYDDENEVSIEPATSVSIAQYLGLSDVECFDVSNACAGMFTGLYTAKSMIADKTAKRVLVISGEYITKLGETVLKESQMDSNYEMQDLLASLTLSDSAVAMIVEESKSDIGFTDLQLRTYGEHSHLCTGYPVPNGPLMFTKSRELAIAASQYSAKHTVQTIHDNNWAEESIRYLIPHQTAEKVIHAGICLVNEKADQPLFDLDNTLINLKNRGNTSTTTHFVALMDKILDGSINKGDKLVFAISASGITVGTALYTMDDLPERVRRRKRIGNKAKSPPALKNQAKRVPTVNVSAIEVLPKDYRGHRRTFDMIGTVVNNMLKKRKTTDGKIGLILFSGIYTTDHISEPAVAAMILKEIKLDPVLQAKHFKEDIFAFDIKNGSRSTQKAMELASSMMAHNKIENALLITSEISQPALHSYGPFPVENSATAMILSSATAPLQMTKSRSYNFWQFINDYEVFISWDKGDMGLKYRKCHVLYQKYLVCIEEAVEKFFESTDSSWADYDHIAIPSISSLFQAKFFRHFSTLTVDKVIPMEIEKDLFTAQVPMSLSEWTKLETPSKKLLQIQVASGMQVTISVWENKSA